MDELPPELFIEGIFNYLPIKHALTIIDSLQRLKPFRQEVLLSCCCWQCCPDCGKCMDRLCSFKHHCLNNNLKEAEEVCDLLKLNITSIMLRLERCGGRTHIGREIYSEVRPYGLLILDYLLEDLVKRDHLRMFYWIVKRLQIKTSDVYIDINRFHGSSRVENIVFDFLPPEELRKEVRALIEDTWVLI